jgi:hypothetical protein
MSVSALQIYAKNRFKQLFGKKNCMAAGHFLYFLFFFPRIVGKNRKDCIIFAAWNPDNPDNPETPEIPEERKEATE